MTNQEVIYSLQASSKSVLITGTVPTALTDYPIRLKVFKTNGTDTGATVYLENKCRNDFGDLRFNAVNSTTQLSYWIDPAKLITGVSAEVWVKIPNIPASPNSTLLYINYGDTALTSQSNADNVFTFFDDTFATSYTTTIDFNNIPNFSNQRDNIDKQEGRLLNMYREQQGYQNVTNGVYEIHPCCYSNACMHTEALPEIYINSNTNYTVEFSARTNGYNTFISGNSIFNCIFEETTTDGFGLGTSIGFYGDYRRNPDTDFNAPATGTGYTLAIVTDAAGKMRFPGFDFSVLHTYKMEIIGLTIRYYIDNVLKYTDSLTSLNGRTLRFKIAEGGNGHVTYVDYIQITTNRSLNINKWRFAANTRFSNNSDTLCAGRLYVETPNRLYIGAHCQSNIESTLNIRPNVTFGRGTLVEIQTQTLNANGSITTPGDAAIGYHITDTLANLNGTNNGIFTLLKTGTIQRHKYKINGILTDAAPSSVGIGTYNIKMIIDENGRGKVLVNDVQEMSFAGQLPDSLYTLLLWHLAKDTVSIYKSEQKISKVLIRKYVSVEPTLSMTSGCIPAWQCRQPLDGYQHDNNNCLPDTYSPDCLPATTPPGDLCIMGKCISRSYLYVAGVGVAALLMFRR